jgi:hypothetical protein
MEEGMELIAARTFALEFSVLDLRAELLGSGVLRPLTDERIADFRDLIEAEMATVAQQVGVPAEDAERFARLTARSFELIHARLAAFEAKPASETP